MPLAKPENDTMTASSIEHFILCWLGEHAPSVDVGLIDAEESLFSLGIDSLAMVALGEDLEKLTGEPVSLDVIVDHPSPRTLSEYLASKTTE